MTSTIGSTVLGYPRIGPNRELKRALERYWASRGSEAELRAVARELRADTWRSLAAAGLDSMPGNTFSFYDHVLDTAVMVDAVPRRFTNLGLHPLDTYFAMARGVASTPPLEMTKWFDTNYHYLVPEIGPDTRFALADRTPVEQYREAAELGVTTRPVLVGPLTFLLLSNRTTTRRNRSGRWTSSVSCWRSTPSCCGSCAAPGRSGCSSTSPRSRRTGRRTSWTRCARRTTRWVR